MATQQQAPKTARRQYVVPIALLGAAASGLVGAAAGYYVDESQHTPPAVYFSPAAGCTKAVTDEVRKSRKEIHVQVYDFNSSPIASALIDAHKSGVTVLVLMDRGQLKKDAFNQARNLAQAGITVRVDGQHAGAHDKVMIVDGLEVLTGSFNYTSAAEGVEFPTKSGHGVNDYSDCSYSAGETYPSDE